MWMSTGEEPRRHGCTREFAMRRRATFKGGESSWRGGTYLSDFRCPLSHPPPCSGSPLSGTPPAPWCPSRGGGHARPPGGRPSVGPPPRVARRCALVVVAKPLVMAVAETVT